jgi:diacylglycerol O-acyltransferase
MTSDVINGLDMAFLCLERDTAPMHIGALAVFGAENPPDTVQIAKLLAARAQRLPRMRFRVRTAWFRTGGARWETHPDFLAADHVYQHHLPSPGGQGELAALTSELAAEPLDLSRPLWELHVITGLEGHRFALLVKLHHALADGAKAVELGLNLLDSGQPCAQAPQPPPERTALSLARGVFRCASHPKWLFRNVTTAAGELRNAARQTGETLNIASSVVRSTRMPPTDSPFAAPHSGTRRIELIPLALDDLRRIRKYHGGTTHDVLLAVVTGALRRWLADRGQPVEDLTIRALVPVSQRLRAGGSGSNLLSGYLCDLPVGESDPLARLRAVQSEMDRNKTVGPLRGPGAIPVLAGRVPGMVHRLATSTVGRGASLLFDTVVTNVPLPDRPLSLGGSRLLELYPFVPLPAGHALSIAASQYRGTVHVGLQANRAALPDMEKLNESLRHSLAELDDLSR